MNGDFLKYIELVGTKKVREDLKVTLQKATVKENWNLIQEIISFIENNLDENNDDITGSTAASLEDITQNLNNEEIWQKLKDIIAEQLEILKEDIYFETVIQCNSLDVPSNHHIYENNNKNSNNLITGVIDLFVCSSSWSSGSMYSDAQLKFIELIMAVEEEFNIEITDEQAEELTTVQSLFDLVISYLSE